MTATSLDIILPCYNPSKNWAENIIQEFQEIKNRIKDIDITLIMVNDGTSTISLTDIQKLKDRIPQFVNISYDVNKGKGYALREGIKTSIADVCIYTDIDFPYTTNSFIKIWDQIVKGKTDIAAGVKDKSYYKHVPAGRKFISKILRTGSKNILRLKISDTQCGLKGFNKKGKDIFLKTTINRYLFDLEFIFLVSRQKEVSMVPVEIELKENIQFSSMRTGILLSEGFNFLKIFFKSF